MYCHQTHKFQVLQVEEEDRGCHLGASPPEPLEVLLHHFFLLGDNSSVLTPRLMEPYNRRQLSRENRIANFRISRSRRVVDKAFGILVSRFMVLLNTMERKPNVFRETVLT